MKPGPYQRETPGKSGKFMPLISYNASVGINKKQNRKQQLKKLRQKITLLTSTTMTIAVIVANTSHATIRASSATSDSKESANKSSDYWSAGNYHLVIFRQKRRMGNVPHKSPGNKALVIPNSDTTKK
jgi:hypothetical protein